MKTTIIALTLFAASFAQASFYQTDCSSADGMIQYKNGHVNNAVLVSFYDYQNNQPELVTMDLGIEVDVERDVKQELFAESGTTCAEDSESGIWQSQIRTYEIMTLTKKNRSTFHPSTPGVSEDLLTVRVPVLCEHNMNSRAFCE